MRDAHVYRQNVGSVHLRMRVSFTAESTESGSLQDLIGYFFPLFSKAILRSQWQILISCFMESSLKNHL